MTRHRKAFVVVPALLCALAAATGVLAASNPVTGSIFGQVTSVKGDKFVVKTTQSPKGSSTVSVGSKTVISEQVAGKTSDLVKGACVFASGQKGKKGTVAAVQIALQTSSKGKCGTGFGGRPGGRPGGGTPPSGTKPPGGGGLRFGGAFGFASGTISSAKTGEIVVKGQNGSTTVTITSKTRISETKVVNSSAIATKSCVSVRGTSTDQGVTVSAESIDVSQPTKSGCTAGFRRGRP